MKRALARKVGDVRRDWRFGVYYAYPRCCIAAYCWDRIWSLPPSMTRCVGQGVEPAESSCEWVPCGVFHHGGAQLRLLRRIQRIGGFWWLALSPRSALWRRTAGDRLVPRPPWVALATEVAFDLTRAKRPTEDAFAELEAGCRNSELSWT